jgi:radical SAM superfamily enzyme YgiQ (UPF0313 family)
MKKVLFIRAIESINEVATRYPGLGLAYLVSALRSHFSEDYFEFKIIERGSVAEVKKQILSFKPDIVGISTITQDFNIAKEYAAFCKSESIPVIMGGVHITMLPESLFKEVELACLGESEETIIEVFELFDKRGEFLKDEIRKIKGIVFRDDNGELIITEPRPLIENLDDIKLPARDLLNIEKHSYIFSSRGCPYKCSFCASTIFWDKVRLFSAEYVVNEIEELHNKYDVKMISFFDDLFIINKKRLADIAALLKEKGLDNKIKFSCSCRSNLVNEEVAGLLKDIGIVSVGLGLESGSQRVLKYLKGDSTSVEHNKKAVLALKAHGIAVNASFVIGSPDETEEEMMETYDFIKKVPLDLVDVYVLTPLPGTPVWRCAEGRGLVSKDMDWTRLNINFEENHKDAIIVSKIYDHEQMYRIYKKFRRLRLYINVKNIWHSPFLMDLPKYICKVVYGKIVSAFKPSK